MRAGQTSLATHVPRSSTVKLLALYNESAEFNRRHCAIFPPFKYFKYEGRQLIISNETVLAAFVDEEH
jgi:hypothetical protein